MNKSNLPTIPEHYNYCKITAFKQAVAKFNQDKSFVADKSGKAIPKNNSDMVQSSKKDGLLPSASPKTPKLRSALPEGIPSNFKLERT